MRNQNDATHGWGSALRLAFRPILGGSAELQRQEEEEAKTTTEAVAMLKTAAATLSNVAEDGLRKIAQDETDPLAVAMRALSERITGRGH